MADMLKGNYPLTTNVAAERRDEASTLEEQFEKSALEKLGGSMTFVKKSTKFVWKGEPAK